MIVTNLLTGLMIVIFGLYQTSTITHLPCEQNILSILVRNYIHLDPIHLFINLMVFYQLSFLETQLHSWNYLILIAILTCLQSLLQIILNQIVPLVCSIGFSGILYGLVTYQLMQNHATKAQLLSFLTSVILISLAIPNLSLSGHIVGCLSGYLVGWLSQ